MKEDNELLANLILELRRGTLIRNVLSQLGEAKYGYHLVQILESKNNWREISQTMDYLLREDGYND